MISIIILRLITILSYIFYLKYDFDFHFHCWNFESLCEDLTHIGFKEIRKYDWRKTEHFYVDDYSQAYLPHMDKAKGRLMSLNVEAIK